MNKRNKHLAQLLQREDISDNDLAKVIEEVFKTLKNSTPWGLRYYYDHLKGRGFEPTEKEIQESIKKTIKLLEK